MKNFRKILELPQYIKSLSNQEKELFNRIYTFYLETGFLKMPDTLKTELSDKFLNCEKQRIIRITNKITFESTLFNEFRAKRPLDTKVKEDLYQIIENSRGGAFCNPLEKTPLDIFGRIEGKHCITGSNLAKYDYLHAVIVFKDHEPFIRDSEKIKDYLEVAYKWFKKANEYDKTAIYPFFMWNCLWRAGASLIHGHAQVLISKEPYAKQKFLNYIRKNYFSSFGSEYFEDIFKIHEILGLAFEYENAKLMAYLTPIKEKEIIIISPDLFTLAKPISLVLECYYKLGVRSFNLAIFMPPLNSQDIFITRIVDRGDPLTRTCDIGGMELYAGTSVVASDPFILIKELEKIKI